MSTRFQIAAKLADNRHACIYVHCDGYPSHALALLQRHYTDQQKIDRLIALGDCLSIGPELESCDTFFGRAGEDWEDVKATYGESLKEAADMHKHGDEQYRYFWDGKSWALAEF